MRTLSRVVSLFAGLLAVGCATRPPEAAPAGSSAPAISSPSSDASSRASAATESAPRERIPGESTPRERAQPESAGAGTSSMPVRPPYAERWYGNAVLYEVMVRSFFDSDGDGIGDLKGLTRKLDYLNTGDPRTTTDLKVDGLWLMPIFKSPSYHGYDATDFYQIDPAYGTLDDFKTLVAEAHKRGIRILLDLVLNHTSNQHPWFQRAGKGPDAPERAWYVWRRDDPGWERPWGGGPVWHQRGDWYYYGLFWEGMPDLNYDHPPVRDEMTKVAKYWLEQGADGYRLDAIRYLYEEGKERQADLASTHGFLEQLSRTLHAQKPDMAMVGEIWTDTKDVAPYYGRGDELDLAFGFDEAAGIVASLQGSSPAPLVEALERVAAAYPERRFSAPFLTNHDMPRLATLLDADPARLKLAAAVLLSLPGTPFLYQGEEIGLTNGPREGDEGKRTPMQWDTSANAGFTPAATPWNPLAGRQDTVSVAAELGKTGSLLTWYQALIRQRHSSAALRTGTLLAVAAGNGTDSGRLTFQRAASGEVVVCLFNFGSTPLPATKVAVDAGALEAAGLSAGEGARALTAVELGSGAARAVHAAGGAGGAAVVVETPALPARGAAWIRLSRSQAG